MTDPTPTNDLGLCPNCDSELRGEYCSACGQHNRHRRLGLRGLVGDFGQQLFDLDSTLLRTLRGLLTNPGRLAADYVSGRRARYVNPLRLFLVATAVFLAAYKLSGLGLEAGLGMDMKFQGDPEAMQRLHEIQRFLASQLNNLVIVVLPLHALLQRLLFRRFGYNYTETLAFLFYVQGQLFLFGVLALLVAPWRADAVVPLRLAVHVCYFIWACRGFYAGGWVRTVILALVSIMGYMMLTGLLAMATFLTVMVRTG